MLINFKLSLTSFGSLQTHAMSNMALLCATQPETIYTLVSTWKRPESDSIVVDGCLQEM